MKTTPLKWLLSATVCAAISSAAAADSKFSWFDKGPGGDRLGFLNSAPSPLSPANSRVSFGVDAFKSLAPNRLVDEDANVTDSNDPKLESDVVRLYGEIGNSRTDSTAPLKRLNAPGPLGTPIDGSDARLNALGIKWRHRVDAVSTLAVSAGYNENAWQYQAAPEIGTWDTRAALSWTSHWSSGLRPGITGSLFVGDEAARDEAYQHLGRKYYGMALGGQLTLFQDHTPYVSYRVQRNTYSGLYNSTATADELMYPLARFDDHSLVSAGWRWQARPNLSFHAEASYGLNANNNHNLDPYAAERSRIFFGTRFDFR